MTDMLAAVKLELVQKEADKLALGREIEYLGKVVERLGQDKCHVEEVHHVGLGLGQGSHGGGRCRVLKP